MRGTRIVPVLMGAMALAAWLSAASQAQESSQGVAVAEDSSAISQEVSSLRAEIATLRAQIQSGAGASFEGDDGCGCGGGGGCDCCWSNPCCRSQGFFASAELAYLKPHNSAGTGFNLRGLSIATQDEVVVLGATTDANLNLAVDPDFRESGRFTVGWQRCDGLGVRARYWEFDHPFDAGATIVAGTEVIIPGADIDVIVPADLPATVSHSWDAKTIDLELFDTTKLGCHWDATWSLGFRYVNYEERRAISVDVPGLVEAFVAQIKRFEGIGLTSSYELRSQLTCNLGFFANVRGSVLMGDETDLLPVFIDVTDVGTTDLTFRERQKNDVKFIYEAQVGAEYILPICGGGYYFARAGVEMQYWDNFGVSPTGLLFDESTGFGGFFASVGIQR